MNSATGATGSRYTNLIAVSEGLVTYGAAVKVISALLGGAVALGGCVAGRGQFALLGIMAGGFIALTGFSMGMVIAALGEGLRALADIATNTTPAAAAEVLPPPVEPAARVAARASNDVIPSEDFSRDDDDLQGVRTCQHCHRSVPRNERVCPRCGKGG